MHVKMNMLHRDASISAASTMYDASLGQTISVEVLYLQPFVAGATLELPACRYISIHSAHSQPWNCRFDFLHSIFYFCSYEQRHAGTQQIRGLCVHCPHLCWTAKFTHAQISRAMQISTIIFLEIAYKYIILIGLLYKLGCNANKWLKQTKNLINNQKMKISIGPTHDSSILCCVNDYRNRVKLFTSINRLIQMKVIFPNRRANVLPIEQKHPKANMGNKRSPMCRRDWPLCSELNINCPTGCITQHDFW